jgi:hypothetical protein
MTKFKLLALSFVAASSFLTALYAQAEDDNSGFVEGGKVYSIVNLHADFNRNRFYALNYQLPKVITVCSEFVIEDIGTKDIELTHQGADYDYVWDKHTRGAGQSLEENFKLFFAKSCDAVKAKIKTLSKVDQKGIKLGKPQVGMTKEGILIALGRPPIHATPSLDAANWLYWNNKWTKDLLEFDEKGILKQIID